MASRVILDFLRLRMSGAANRASFHVSVPKPGRVSVPKPGRASEVLLVSSCVLFLFFSGAEPGTSMRPFPPSS